MPIRYRPIRVPPVPRLQRSGALQENCDWFWIHGARCEVQRGLHLLPAGASGMEASWYRHIHDLPSHSGESQLTTWSLLASVDRAARLIEIK